MRERSACERVPSSQLSCEPWAQRSVMREMSEEDRTAPCTATTRARNAAFVDIGLEWTMARPLKHAGVRAIRPARQRRSIFVDHDLFLSI